MNDWLDQMIGKYEDLLNVAKEDYAKDEVRCYELILNDLKDQKAELIDTEETINGFYDPVILNQGSGSGATAELAVPENKITNISFVKIDNCTEAKIVDGVMTELKITNW